MPDRNIERMLRDTHVPVPAADMQRLDLVLRVGRKLPSLCDVTCVKPITTKGFARSGTTTIKEAILRDATRDNVANYRKVVEPGLVDLLRLGCEVFGRWSDHAVRSVLAMAAERARSLPPLVRRGSTQALAARWGLLAVATQRLVPRAVLRDASADLNTTLLKEPPRRPARQRVLSGWLGPWRRTPPAAASGRLSLWWLGLAG